jgi:hypothetical protein
MSKTLIVGEHAEDLVEALRVLGGCNIALQTKDVVRRASTSLGAATGVVLFLTERDNMAELRMLLSTSDARFLLVAPTSPPRASLARIARQYGTGLCSREDALPFREAMLVAFGAGRWEYAVS